MSETKFPSTPLQVLKGKYGLQIHSAKPGVELGHWVATIKCESCPAYEDGYAALFAAAPDLYAAALLARQQLIDHGFDGLASGLDAAISKARGETP
jgi:hypothetical protein